MPSSSPEPPSPSSSSSSSLIKESKSKKSPPQKQQPSSSSSSSKPSKQQQQQKQKQPYMEEVIGKSVQIKFVHHNDDDDDDEDTTTKRKKSKKRLPITTTTTTTTTKFYLGVIHDMKTSYNNNSNKKKKKKKGGGRRKKQIWHYVRYEDNDAGWVDLRYMESIGSLKWPTTNTNTNTNSSSTTSSSSEKEKEEEVAVAAAVATTTTTTTTTTTAANNNNTSSPSSSSIKKKATTRGPSSKLYLNAPWIKRPFSEDLVFELLIKKVVNIKYNSITGTYTLISPINETITSPEFTTLLELQRYCFLNPYDEYIMLQTSGITTTNKENFYLVKEFERWTYYAYVPGTYNDDWCNIPVLTRDQVTHMLTKKLGFTIMRDDDPTSKYFICWKSPPPPPPPTAAAAAAVVTIKKNTTTSSDDDDDDDDDDDGNKNKNNNNQGVLDSKYQTYEDLCSALQRIEDIEYACSGGRQQQQQQKQLEAQNNNNNSKTSSSSSRPSRHRSIPPKLNNQETMALRLYLAESLFNVKEYNQDYLCEGKVFNVKEYNEVFNVKEHNEEDEEEKEMIDCNDNEEQEEDVEDQDENDDASSSSSSSSTSSNTSKKAAPPIIKNYNKKGSSSCKYNHLKFAQKIWMMVNETTQNYPKILSWIDNGKAFQIHDNQELESKILFNYFDGRSDPIKVNHNFKRNLKWYGFTLIGCGDDDPHQDGCIFQHKCFVSDNYDLASQIRRLIKYPSSWKTSSSISSSLLTTTTSSSSNSQNNNNNKYASNNQNNNKDNDDDDVGSDDDDDDDEEDEEEDEDEEDLDWNNQDSNDDDDDDASTSSSEQKKKRQRNHSKLSSRARKKRKSVATAASAVVKIEDEDEDDDIHPTSEEKKKYTRKFHPRGKTIRFPAKLWQILESSERDPNWKKIISWVDNGGAFKVHNREKFESIVYPQYFPYNCSDQTLPYHNFQRNLRSYGFGRLDHGYFRHPMFVRRDQQKAESIVCRRANIVPWSRLTMQNETAKGFPIDEDGSEEEDEEDEEGLRNLPFPKKLWKILDWAEKDPSWKEIVSWTNNGTAFRIHNRRAFESVVMPFYFKAGKNGHTRRYPYTNFKHTLRWYGFVMVQEECYRHERFTRRNRKRAQQVAMLKSCPTVQESTDLYPVIKTEEVDEDVDESSGDDGDEDESRKSDQDDDDDDDDDEEVDFEKNRRLRFPEKLWHMLDRSERNPKWKKIISWADNGTVIQVHDREDFIKTIMPCYFAWKASPRSKEVYVSNFQRSLRDYGFERFKRSDDDVYDDCYRHNSFTRHDIKGAKNIIYLGSKQYKSWSYAQHNLKTARQPPYPSSIGFVSSFSIDSRGTEERSTSWSSSRATTSNRRAAKKRKRNSSLSEAQNKEEDDDDEGEEKEDFTKMTVPELAEIFQKKHKEMGEIMALLNQKLAAEEEDEEEVKKDECEDDNVRTNQNDNEEGQQEQPPQGQGGEMIHDDTTNNNNGDESEIRASMLREMNIDSLEL